jgi:glycosyltransferase involved in cell wall biosynthesis
MSTEKKSHKTPKIAVFYDWLNQQGGAEKVLLDILSVYPHADLYTLIYDPTKTNWLPQKIKIYPSFLNKLSLTKKNNLFHTPFYGLFLEQFNFSKYDIVISTTSTIGHCLLTPPKTLFLCYFHNINRYLYQTPSQFKFLKPLLKKYQKTDFIYGQRPDYLLCNSKTVQQRIQKTYERPAKIIYPGIDTSFFVPNNKNSSVDPYFLIVSRLVRHKKIDLAIRACQDLNQKLIIVGQGRDYHYLLKIKNKNPNSKIFFINQVSPKKLLTLYQNCQALICPQIEDFGLSPLEAQACGKPVIAFDQGGITESIINGKTGIFFKHQTTQSLKIAIKKFNNLSFDPQYCTKNAAKFSRNNFMLNFKRIINQLWQQHQITIS